MTSFNVNVNNAFPPEVLTIKLLNSALAYMQYKLSPVELEIVTSYPGGCHDIFFAIACSVDSHDLRVRYTNLCAAFLAFSGESMCNSIKDDRFVFLESPLAKTLLDEKHIAFCKERWTERYKTPEEGLVQKAAELTV